MDISNALYWNEISSSRNVFDSYHKINHRSTVRMAWLWLIEKLTLRSDKTNTQIVKCTALEVPLSQSHMKTENWMQPLKAAQDPNQWIKFLDFSLFQEESQIFDDVTFVQSSIIRVHYRILQAFLEKSFDCFQLIFNRPKLRAPIIKLIIMACNKLKHP